LKALHSKMGFFSGINPPCILKGGRFAVTRIGKLLAAVNSAQDEAISLVSSEGLISAGVPSHGIAATGAKPTSCGMHEATSNAKANNVAGNRK
jgi:hypothetical protein